MGEENNKDVSVPAEVGVETTPGHEEEKKGTNHDQRDMVRMGKMQETRVRKEPFEGYRSLYLHMQQRNFRFLSIFGFTMVLMATWEAQFSASFFVLLNGGTGGAVWIYIGTFVGFLGGSPSSCCPLDPQRLTPRAAAVASMSEMASMAPTTGGQYHW